MSLTDLSNADLAARRRNARVALICFGVFVLMVAAARADVASTTVLAKQVTISFDTNVRDLPWTFTADQRSQPAKIGETKLALFRVTNNSDRAITGRAVFNVTPESAGAYFRKLDCFCFTDQTIGPRQTVDMPVLYFIDPGYAEDINTKGETDLTLSYTFYPSVEAGGK
jgi:cytochrome c oxidase assembly protein subunit 11